MQDDIRREAQTMSLIDHPNVIRAYCSFVVDHCLWVVMPFMAEGSCLHLMKIAYPDGFEEPVIGSILKEALKALEYLHRHGHIHRDVKVYLEKRPYGFYCCFMFSHVSLSKISHCRLEISFFIVQVRLSLGTSVFQLACLIRVIGNAQEILSLELHAGEIQDLLSTSFSL